MTSDQKDKRCKQGETQFLGYRQRSISVLAQWVARVRVALWYSAAMQLKEKKLCWKNTRCKYDKERVNIDMSKIHA